MYLKIVSLDINICFKDICNCPFSSIIFAIPLHFLINKVFAYCEYVSMMIYVYKILGINLKRQFVIWNYFNINFQTHTCTHLRLSFLYKVRHESSRVLFFTKFITQSFVKFFFSHCHVMLLSINFIS